MEDYESAKLRMACLDLAKQVALASCSGSYSIVVEAKNYWNFVKGESKTGVPPAKSDDEIPF
jgi:uncharacterized linocin/CFP29 family protein